MSLGKTTELYISLFVFKRSSVFFSPVKIFNKPAIVLNILICQQWALIPVVLIFSKDRGLLLENKSTCQCILAARVSAHFLWVQIPSPPLTLPQLYPSRPYYSKLHNLFLHYKKPVWRKPDIFNLLALSQARTAFCTAGEEASLGLLRPTPFTWVTEGLLWAPPATCAHCAFVKRPDNSGLWTLTLLSAKGEECFRDSCCLIKVNNMRLDEKQGALWGEIVGVWTGTERNDKNVRYPPTPSPSLSHSLVFYLSPPPHHTHTHPTVLPFLKSIYLLYGDAKEGSEP